MAPPDFSSIVPHAPRRPVKAAWSKDRPQSFDGLQHRESPPVEVPARSQSLCRIVPVPSLVSVDSPAVSSPRASTAGNDHDWRPKTFSGNLTLIPPGCPSPAMIVVGGTGRQAIHDSSRPSSSERPSPGSRVLLERPSTLRSASPSRVLPETPGVTPSPSLRDLEIGASARESKQSVWDSFRDQFNHNRQSVRSSTFKVAKTAMDASTKSFEMVKFGDAVEPALQLYFEDCCADGLPPWIRIGKTLIVGLSLLFLLPALSFATLLMPLPAPSAGFWANWAFNFLAHPVLNYVPARAQLELLSRIIEPSERYRVRWIVLWVPLVDPLVCLLIHGIGSIFGLYPFPYAIITSCIPAAVAALVVAGFFVPKDLMTPDVRGFVKFNLLSWLFWALQFLVLMLWLLCFPLLSPTAQLFCSFVLGENWWMDGSTKVLHHGIEGAHPLYAGKAIGVLMKMWLYLTKSFANDWTEDAAVDESSIVEEHGICPLLRPSKLCQSCCQMKSFMLDMWSHAREMGARLKHIFEEIQFHTRDSLQDLNIKAADARLLDHFARFIVLFTMVEICEVLVPLIYMIVASLLHSDALGHNRSYFYVFKDMRLHQALVSNSIAFLIEAVVLLVVHVGLLRSVGFNIFNFAGIILKMDFWYWSFALGGMLCCLGHCFVGAYRS
eukprot:symbB.v1.2.013864.t2/scaffold993.1/size146112/3